MASVAMSMTFAMTAMTFFVVMMMSVASIMAAGAVTIDNCSAEILLYDLLNGKFRRATMYLYAKLIK